PLRMGGARLERAGDCVLPIHWCAGAGPVEDMPPERRCPQSFRTRRDHGMKIVLVAAVADNNVIGANGGMPWRLRSDMAHFRRLTLNKPVIMGRKTYESIGKPLKDRTNIVITRDAGRS